MGHAPPRNGAANTGKPPGPACGAAAWIPPWGEPVLTQCFGKRPCRRGAEGPGPASPRRRRASFDTEVDCGKAVIPSGGRRQTASAAPLRLLPGAGAKTSHREADGRAAPCAPPSRAQSGARYARGQAGAGARAERAEKGSGAGAAERNGTGSKRGIRCRRRNRRNSACRRPKWRFHARNGNSICAFRMENMTETATGPAARPMQDPPSRSFRNAPARLLAKAVRYPPARLREGPGEGLPARRASPCRPTAGPLPASPASGGGEQSKRPPRCLPSPSLPPCRHPPSRLREGPGEGPSARRASPCRPAAGPLPASPASGGGEQSKRPPRCLPSPSRRPCRHPPSRLREGSGEGLPARQASPCRPTAGPLPASPASGEESNRSGRPNTGGCRPKRRLYAWNGCIICPLRMENMTEHDIP